MKKKTFSAIDKLDILCLLEQGYRDYQISDMLNIDELIVCSIIDGIIG